jgi:agmatine deiminase
MAARDARGRRLKVHKLPSPGPLRRTDAEAAGLQVVDGAKPRGAGERLAASYVNAYLANGGVVMPLLDGKRDADAAAVLKRVFRDREVVGVPAREILLGGGSIHCITQQIPAVMPRPRGLPR